MDIYFENFLKTIRHQETFPVPVAIFNVAPFTTNFIGTEINTYYQDVALKMLTQLKLAENFPEVIMIPGVWPDFGPVVECSAFGSEVIWMDNSPPFIKRVFDSYQEISKIKTINPERDGLMPKVLEQYRYMWEHLDGRYIENRGYLDGLAVTMGPIEIAGLLIDYQNFFCGLYDAPKEIKTLIDVVTESVLLWIEAQEKTNGKLKQLLLIDHMPSQLSPEFFEEFCFPYLKKIFETFSYAIRIYHNEGNVLHILQKIKDMGVDLFHLGIDLLEAKKRIGDQVALWGNLHPVNVLLEKSPSDILEECFRCLEVGAPGGGFVLSSGGGLAPQTPKENIDAMVRSVKLWRPDKFPRE